MTTSPRRLKAVASEPGRAVLYVRVSALMGRGGEDFHSPGMQVEHMRRAIGVAGLREVAVVEDLDRSGQTFAREGIETIRRMVADKKIDVVAVYDLSRLGRDLAESLAFVRWLRERDVQVISAQERIDETPEGQYMLGMFLGLAELYGAQVGRRWAQIVERRARAGKHHGVVPQGYRREDSRMVVDPVLGPAVTAMFEAYAAGDYVSEIMRRFAAARGRPVRRETVKSMLRNETYRGRTIVRSAIAGLLDLDGEHPPLVDEATWDKVRRRLARDRRVPPRTLEPKYSLTGLMWCAHCEGPLQVWYSPENGGVRRLVCSRARQMTDVCTGVGTPPYAALERAVLDGVTAYAAELTANPTERAARMARKQRAGLDVATLRAELSATRTAMGRITQRWGRGLMPDVAHELAMADLTATEALLVVRLDEAGLVAQAPAPGEAVVLVDEMLRLWDELTAQERNRGLRAIVRRVYVRRAERWREPIDDRITDVDWVF